MRRFFLLLTFAVLCTVGPWGVSVASADTLGQRQEFRVNPSYDADGARRASFTLRTIGTRAYFYVDDRYWALLTPTQQSRYQASLQSLAAQFDAVIYPRSIALWGTIADPGVDGDARVVVVLERLMAGSGGYFETIHNYTATVAPEGNAREMIFVNADSVLADTAARLAAHEFQHLISFQQRELTTRAIDDIWLNEGRSEFNVTNVGYNLPYEGSTLQRRAQTFLRTPSDSLTDWPNTSTDYAAASLFVHYITDRFGPEILASTEHTTAAGTAAVDEWLVSHGAPRFGEVFTDWMVAAYLNDRSVDPSYGYTTPGLQTLHVPSVAGGRLDATNTQLAIAQSMKEWQPFWLTTDVNIDDTTASELHVQIDGVTDVTWSGAVMASYRDGAVSVKEYTGQTGSVAVPTHLQGSDVVALSVAVTHGNVQALAGRTIAERPVTVRVALGAVQGGQVTVPMTTTSGAVADGDLIRRAGQADVYVVWGPYRRYLGAGVLELYGFQSRPVREVSDVVFFGYQASVYIRAQNGKQVFSVWPDGTKHWLNITATQWDASGRDWGAIFMVNDLEVAHYAAGGDILR